jgi:hypothetical protein
LAAMMRRWEWPCANIGFTLSPGLSSLSLLMLLLRECSTSIERRADAGHAHAIVVRSTISDRRGQGPWQGRPALGGLLRWRPAVSADRLSAHAARMCGNRVPKVS